jgi:hypothetical protein
VEPPGPKLEPLPDAVAEVDNLMPLVDMGRLPEPCVSWTGLFESVVAPSSVVPWPHALDMFDRISVSLFDKESVSLTTSSLSMTRTPS